MATTASTTHPSTTYGDYSFPPFTTFKNLGPLTTSLSFPQNCFSNLYDLNKDGLGPSGAWKTQGCAISTCCPSGNYYSDDWAWMTSYYSPGVCPSQYQSCSPPTRSGLILTPSAHEKIIFCCPESYVCPNSEDMLEEAPGACGSRLTSSAWPTLYTVLDNIHHQSPVTTLDYDFEPGYTQEVQIAYPIQIRVHSNETEPNPPSHFPKGTIIGTVLAGVLVLLFAIGLLLYFLHRRRRRHDAVPPPALDAMAEVGVPSQMPLPGIQELPSPIPTLKKFPLAEAAELDGQNGFQSASPAQYAQAPIDTPKRKAVHPVELPAD